MFPGLPVCSFVAPATVGAARAYRVPRTRFRPDTSLNKSGWRPPGAKGLDLAVKLLDPLLLRLVRD